MCMSKLRNQISEAVGFDLTMCHSRHTGSNTYDDREFCQGAGGAGI